MESGDQEFLNNLLSVLASRQNVTVLCVVKSDTGLELLMNTPDMVLQLGMLDVARLEVVDRHARYREEHEEEIRSAEVRAMAVLGTPGKAN